jgi:hypothetical protein
VGPIVLGGPVFWRLEDAPRVLGFLGDHAPEAPDELGITVAMMLAPPAPFLPPEHHGRPVVGLVLVWCGDPAEGRRAVAPLLKVAPPVAELVRPVPYLTIQSMLDGGAPHGRHYYWRSHRLPALSDEVIAVLVERVASITSPFSQVNGWAMGGAVSRSTPRPPPSASARSGSTSASPPPGPRPTPRPNATSPGSAPAGRRCAPTAPAST